MCKAAALAPAYEDFATLMVNNAVWRDVVAAVPFERRILLLPQCLRHAEDCPASIDELGLLCQQCGRCRIGPLQAQAEELGYVVLVAEGTTVVTQLLQQGKIDAVIGVSCLSVLERAFPHIAAQAIPGLAIPLIKDGCRATEVELDWLMHVLREHSPAAATLTFDFDATRNQVRGWFTPDALSDLLGVPATHAETLAQDWLARAGKRWRPYLTTCVYQALGGTNIESIRPIAVAVECFHKASLIHDDIEDDDAQRYDQETLHREYGVPIALNAGDLLLGEGYRLIAECGLSAPSISALLHAASSAHRALCHGQGEELAWSRRPVPPSPRTVLDIFRLKTAPAFEVALVMGAICAGSMGNEFPALHAFSDALGICYQIRDDLEDLAQEHLPLQAPSILMAISCEQDAPRTESLLRTLRAGGQTPDEDWRTLFHDTAAEPRARQLLHHYRHEAIRALEGVESASLKSLLRRAVAWILGE